MSATGQNNNNDTQRIDTGTGTVRLNDNNDTQRIDIGTGTVRLNNNNDTQRMDNDTQRIAGGSSAAFSSMGNLAGIMPQQNAQIGNVGASNDTGEGFNPGQVIEINGRNYTIEKFNKTLDKVISGEAVIYKVSMDGKPAVLKYYKPGYSLPEAVLSKIKDNPKSRIIKLFDYGRRNNQDYEIMEYAEGGTLNDYLNKNGIRDIAELKKIVGQIIEGLEQLHKDLNILYQDLKPENIYFRDVNRTEIILADFGISSVMNPGEDIIEVPANATTVYAAQELARIGNEKNVKVGPPVDYFALGITMLQLWLGEKPFPGMPESERSRQIRDKDVIFPSDMDISYKKLIQGLIQPLPKDRWGSQQIKKWLAGESLEIDYSKVSINYEPQMFNRTESFATPAELAALMIKYPDEGKKGLFSSSFIILWLQKAGDNILAARIEDIKTTYAADRDVGLFLAIYSLDPTFISQGGKKCFNTTEIADAIMAESAYYMEDLKKANSKLYIYFEAVEGQNGKDVAEQLRKNFEEYSPKRALSLVYLKLQSDGGQSIKLGEKIYQSPEEVVAETDSKQIALIKKAVQEEDSLFLVWLSDYYGEFFTTTGGFFNLKPQDRFFLLSLFPFLSYKEFVHNWEQIAITDLVFLIHSSPGRFDLFEAYAAQGLPFSGQVDTSVVSWQPTPMSYLAMFFKELINDEAAGLELVSFLHKKGADINESSGDGSFPLSMAVRGRSKPLVKLLLELGANVNKTDGHSTPLLYALGKNDDNEEEADRIAIAHLLLDYKANAAIIDVHDRYALPMAITLESPDKVELISCLLKAGAGINQKDKNGFSPLNAAVVAHSHFQNKQSALEVIKLLLTKGAKTETLMNNGYFSPLMSAADTNDIEAAQMLLTYGARKDFTDIDGETAFIYAAKRDYKQMMALVDSGSTYKLKSRLFLLLKTAVSILAIGSVFLTIDVLARAILTFHLSYPVLLGVSIFLSHLLTAYILIVLYGPREYLTKLRGTFNFIGGSLRYILGVPIVFPLLVLPLQFLTRFLPVRITSALSYPAEFLTRPSTGFAILAAYIALLAVIMTGMVFFNRANEKVSKQWYMYRYYSGTLTASSGGRYIKRIVLMAVITGLIVFFVLMYKNSPKKAPVGIDMPNVQELVETGQKYYENGDYDNAIKQFDEVIKIDPKNVSGYAWRGNTYRRINQFDTAVKDFNEAISLDPKYSFAYSRRGEAYRAKGDFKAAIKDFNEALTLDPNDSWAYGSRGQAYKQMGQTEQAAQDFKKAISLDPGIDWVKRELQAMEAPRATEAVKTPEAAEAVEASEAIEN
jgi:serine/threonine protein kinase/ankyrin repeat protein/cytochrome c-type biogenesis protein CcmH/NrfG